MTTSSINHRPAAALVAAAATCIGALLIVTGDSAQAIPDRRDQAPAVDRTTVADMQYVEHACFIKPSNWDERTDGPLPRCYSLFPR
ncbi:hypothetical protein [Nocardioides dongkuii]|uniref:hypothetical protein n=1 Tax=Nocardioides dongkuii TaxID=2760089 RepID=UPI0015FDF835|nr:hypothetical protein [Nocardioides dongkuii]